MSKPLLKYKPLAGLVPEKPDPKEPTAEEVAVRLGIDHSAAIKMLQLLRSYQGGHSGNSLIIGGPTGWKWQPTLASDPKDHHGDFSGFGGTHHGHGQLSGVGPDDHHRRIHSTGSDFPAVAEPGDLFYHLILKSLSVKQEV